MKTTRRNFMKLIGVSLLSLPFLPNIKNIESEEVYARRKIPRRRFKAVQHSNGIGKGLVTQFRENLIYESQQIKSRLRPFILR